MELEARRVLDLLLERGVETLYHANTVTTACAFLQWGALLSRGTVELLGLSQTPQKSDATDRRDGIWFDVFTDTVDIHERAARRNLYGPVLFVLDARLLGQDDLPALWVTKKNPSRWQSGEAPGERWHTSLAELEANFVPGRFEQMVVFRHVGGILPFREHLRELVVDDPGITGADEKDLFSFAVGALAAAWGLSRSQPLPVRKRACAPACLCKSEYRADLNAALEAFLPRFVPPSRR
jgi:hypothetical protein